MKNNSKKLNPLLSLLHRLISSIKTMFFQKAENLSIRSDEEELILLCCKLLGCGEPAVRKYVNELSPLEVKKNWEDTLPRRNFKELNVEYEKSALWVGFSPRNGKKRNSEEGLYCDAVLIYFEGERQRNDFIKVLEMEENYYRLWEDCYLDIKTYGIKISVGSSPLHTELPYYISFRKWKGNAASDTRS